MIIILPKKMNNCMSEDIEDVGFGLNNRQLNATTMNLYTSGYNTHTSTAHGNF
jgi:hypothetical protein